MAGSSFCVTSGGVGEIASEEKAGHGLEARSMAKSGLLDGSINGLGASIGGLTDRSNSKVVFRPYDSQATVFEREHDDRAVYRLNRLIGFANKFPVGASRTVAIGGVDQPGFVQEIKGTDFSNAMQSMAIERLGRASNEAVSKMVFQDPASKNSITEAWVERLVIGEQDNQAHNFVLYKGPSGLEMDNIG